MEQFEGIDYPTIKQHLSLFMNDAFCDSFNVYSDDGRKVLSHNAAVSYLMCRFADIGICPEPIDTVKGFSLRFAKSSSETLAQIDINCFSLDSFEIVLVNSQGVPDKEGQYEVTVKGTSIRKFADDATYTLQSICNNGSSLDDDDGVCW